MNPNLGPNPVKPLKNIPYVHIASSDEELNVRENPEGWIGRNLVQPKFDKSINLVHPINFLKPASGFGDEEKFDHEGNFIITKDEPVSDIDDYPD